MMRALIQSRIFYWLGVRFDRALLIQALVMIVMQTLLLHVALSHRPTSLVVHQPFATSEAIFSRPYNFWSWRASKPYWNFLIYFVITLVAGQMLFGGLKGYAELLGYIALAIEALLPIPQILSNHRKRGCKGFRLSVLANWLVGDAFKMIFFFAKRSHEVPWAFKICGIFQALCDCYLGIQFYMFGDGEQGSERPQLGMDMSRLADKAMEPIG